MIRVSAVVLAAGSGTRFGGQKQWALLAGRPVLWFSARAFQKHPLVSDIVIVVPKEQLDMARSFASGFPKIRAVVPGGKTRTDSSMAGVLAAPGDAVLIHDAARPLVSRRLIGALVEALSRARAAAPALPVVDTLKRGMGPMLADWVDRTGLVRVQTPQAFEKSLILSAYEKSSGPETDDTTLVEKATGVKALLVPGDPENIKITTKNDLQLVSKLMGEIKVGFGWDIHGFEDNRPLIIGGVELDFPKGLSGHSDGDVLCHAIIDGMLGAVGLRDIGTHFPDTDPKFKGISSLKLLEMTNELLERESAIVQHIDATVILSEPRLSGHIPVIQQKIASVLQLDPSVVSVKAKSGNGQGPAGQGLACEAHAVVQVRVL